MCTKEQKNFGNISVAKSKYHVFLRLVLFIAVVTL